MLSAKVDRRDSSAPPEAGHSVLAEHPPWFQTGKWNVMRSESARLSRYSLYKCSQPAFKTHPLWAMLRVLSKEQQHAEGVL